MEVDKIDYFIDNWTEMSEKELKKFVYNMTKQERQELLEVFSQEELKEILGEEVSEGYLPNEIVYYNEKTFNEIDEFYESLKNYTNTVKDYTQEDFAKKIVTYRPEMSQTEISRDRDALIKVLEQELEIDRILSATEESVSIANEIKTKIAKKPTAVFPDFEEKPEPRKPLKQKNDTVNNIFNGYEKIFKNTSIFQNGNSVEKFFTVLFSIIILGVVGFVLVASADSILYNYEWYQANKVVVYIMCSALACLIFNKGFRSCIQTIVLPLKVIIYFSAKTKRQQEINSEYKNLIEKYNNDLKNIQDYNEKNRSKYILDRKNFYENFEKEWAKRETNIPKWNKQLDESIAILQETKKKLKSLLEDIHNIFSGAKEYGDETGKRAIIDLLKGFRALSYSEAIAYLDKQKEIEENEARDNAYKENMLRKQEEHNQEMKRLKEQEYEEIKKQNEEMLRLKKQQIEKEEEARKRTKEILEAQLDTQKKQAEEIQKQNEKLSNGLSDVQWEIRNK